jgi:hypothetical protein
LVEDAEVVLRRAPLFDGLDEESARALRRQMADVKLSRGEHLFLEGQETGCTSSSTASSSSPGPRPTAGRTC